MNYIISIKTAILVFPFIALLFTIPFILSGYHKYGSINPLRALIVYSFILYMITIYFLIIFPLPDKDTVVKPTSDMIRLIPFGFIKDFIKETSFVITDPSTYLKTLTEPCFYTVIFNIFITIPFGMYLRYYFKYNLKKTFIISFLLSLFFELTQLSRLYFIYPYQYRIFDVDDLIMNTLGGILGYYIMGLLARFLPTREKIDNDSLKKGRIVSGFRRITIFFLDIILYLIAITFMSIFYKGRYIFYITFIIYYMIVPYIFHSQTIGSKFLNVKLEYPNHRFIRNGLRIIFIYIYYIFIPYRLMLGVMIISYYLNLSSVQLFLLYLLILIIILTFYISNIFVLLKKKTIYYDNIFQCKYISTLYEQGKEKNYKS